MPVACIMDNLIYVMDPLDPTRHHLSVGSYQLPPGLKKQNHHFVLVCTERDLHLAAASKAEMDDWVKSIAQAQARRKEVRRQKQGLMSRASRVFKKSSFSKASAATAQHDQAFHTVAGKDYAKVCV